MRSSGLTDRFRRRPASSGGSQDASFAPAPAPENAPPPTRMQGREPFYGYIVAALIAIAAVLNMVVTLGPRPTTADLIESAVAIVLAGALAYTIARYSHRMLSPFVAIIAAFFITLPPVPTTLSVPHLVVLVVALVWFFIVTQRQRQADKALAKSGVRRGAGSSTATRRRRGSKADEPEPKGPPPNRRYTPPKPKEAAKTRSERSRPQR